MKLSTILVLGFALVTANAFAQGDERDKTFSELDQDQDLLVSPKEAEADPDVLAQFATADQNADGYLDRQEFALIDRGDRKYE